MHKLLLNFISKGFRVRRCGILENGKFLHRRHLKGLKIRCQNSCFSETRFSIHRFLGTFLVKLGNSAGLPNNFHSGASIHCCSSRTRVKAISPFLSPSIWGPGNLFRSIHPSHICVYVCLCVHKFQLASHQR